MIQFIKSLFNYIQLFYSSYNYYVNYTELKDNIDEINRITNLVTTCGAVSIKFCQWITPKIDSLEDKINNKDSFLVTKLKEYYENCPVHNIDYSIQQYNREFNEDIYRTYDIKKVLGSGSIGQVYLVFNKFKNRDEVIKIIHPNIENDIHMFKKIVNFLFFFPCIRNKYKKICPFDINSFIEQFEDQIDLVKEANNNIYFTELYRGNKFIKFPELFKISKNVLIMSYEDGFDFNNDIIDEYNREKLALVFNMFFKTNIMINNYNHGDLHPGNWKVQKYEDDYRIVIYDMGFCWKMSDSIFTELGPDLIDTFEDCDTDFDQETTKKRLCKLLKLSIVSDIDYTDKIKIYIDDKYDSISPWKLCPVKLFKNVISFCNIENLMINQVLAQGFIIIIQVQKIFEENGLMSDGNNIISSKHIYRDRYISLLTMCETYNIFHEFSDFIKDKLNNRQQDINNLFDTINYDDEILSTLENLIT